MGRVGVYPRTIRISNGIVSGINIGANDFFEHKQGCSGVLKRLWYETNTGAGLDSTKAVNAANRLNKDAKENLKLASAWLDTKFGNFMLPASVFLYSHKITINNSKNRARGLKCLLKDGDYTLLSIGCYGFNKDSWQKVVGNRKVVGEDVFFNMEEYQNLPQDLNIGMTVIDDELHSNKEVNLAGVWSGGESCLYLLCDNADYIKQLKDAIRRGAVALWASDDNYSFASPCYNHSDGLGIYILDEVQKIASIY